LELLDLKQQLEKIRGRNIRKDELYESVLKYNNLKKKISEINKLKIKGSKKLRIFQKAILFGPDSLNELENFLEQNKESSADSSNNLTDILLTGCSIFIGDYLIDLIEEGGGNIVYFDTWVGNNYFSQIFDDETLKKNENPLDLFVIRYKNNIYGDHIIPNYLENKVSQLESIIQEYQNKTGKKLGVILHVLKFCDHVSLYQSFIKKILQEKGFQVLILDRDFSKSSRGQIATRLGAFIEMM
jgi:benzoyl-CoA reductase/2-hydroxyglutaryl-CoA dehydratase subunit BcrC/BadD/HgdB